MPTRSEEAPASAASLDRRDAWIGLALLVAVGLFFYASPRPLSHSDEGYFLHHAKRVLDGQAVYRDFHEQYSPLGYYLMAIPLFVFGVTNTTVAATMAALHGALVLCLYAAARRVGVSRGLAASGGLLHLFLCLTVWPIATGHWLAAALMAAIVWLLCRDVLDGRLLFAIGALVGILTGVTHPKGVPVGLAVAAAIAFDHGVRRHFGSTSGSRLVRKALLYAAGIAVIGAPLLGVQLYVAGADALVDQLFGSLSGYVDQNETWWGEPRSVVDGRTLVPALVWLPLLLPLAALRGAFAWRRGDAAEVAKLGVLSIATAGCFAATLYNADVIHIAMVASPAFVLLAETVQWAIRGLAARMPGLGRRERVRGLIEAAVAVAVIGWGAVHVRGVVERLHEEFPHAVETPYGRVDVWTSAEADLVTEVIRAMDGLREREVFCYPHCASMYLLAGARNPTRFDLVFLGGQHRDDHAEEIVEVLSQQRVQYVVIQRHALRRDPIVRYVRRNYRAVYQPEGAAALYRRRRGR